MSNVENMLGLMPKAQIAVHGSSEPLLNFKLLVSAEKRARWHKANKRLASRFSGGGNAIMAHEFDAILLKVEKAAELVPEPAPSKKKGEKKKIGGAV